MASSGDRQMKVTIVGDASGVRRASEEATGALGSLKTAALGLAGAMAAAFAATKVVDFLKDVTKAAIEDEKSQALLAQTLRDTTAARNSDIASTEQWITTTQNATGILDDNLRPALETLLRVTHDTVEAQDILQTAMNISSGTGRDLESVTLALAKAYTGTVGGLGRMGIAVKDLNGDTLSFTQIQKNANVVFGGETQAAADTTSGKLAILSAKWEDLKEEIGAKFLPVIVAVSGYISDTFIPNIERIWNAFTSGDGVINRVIDILNQIKQSFVIAINAIIGVLNNAIQDAGNRLSIFGGILGGIVGSQIKKGQLGTFDPHAADIPHVNIGGGSSRAGFASTIGTLADAAQRAIQAGALANVENTTAEGGGGGGGGGGGKSALELQQEADQKAIEETLKIWAQARIDKRDTEDNMFKDGKLSADQYKAILEQRLTEEKAYSNEWQAEEDKLTSLIKDQKDQQVKDAQDAADALKKIQDQQLKDQEDALRKTMEIQDNEFEVGAITAAAYLGMLEQRLQGLEQFTNEWTQTWEKIQQVAQNAGIAAPSLASAGISATRVGDSIVGGGGMAVSTPGMAVSIQNATFTAQTNSELYNQLIDLGRTQGGIAIPGGVRTVS